MISYNKPNTHWLQGMKNLSVSRSLQKIYINVCIYIFFFTRLLQWPRVENTDTTQAQDTGTTAFTEYFSYFRVQQFELWCSFPLKIFPSLPYIFSTSTSTSLSLIVLSFFWYDATQCSEPSSHWYNIKHSCSALHWPFYSWNWECQGAGHKAGHHHTPPGWLWFIKGNLHAGVLTHVFNN